MNHLCHIFLSRARPDLMLGNFIGDMVTQSEKKILPPNLLNGLKLHYFIDTTIDSHPIYKSAISLLRPGQKKYAPVVMDIYCDFLLTSRWPAYSESTYVQFVDEVYGILSMQLSSIQVPRIENQVKKMIDRNFLNSYASNKSMQSVFEYFSKRASFENNMAHAHVDFQKLEPYLHEKFEQVFPELKELVIQYMHHL